MLKMHLEQIERQSSNNELNDTQKYIYDTAITSYKKKLETTEESSNINDISLDINFMPQRRRNIQEKHKLPHKLPNSKIMSLQSNNRIMNVFRPETTEFVTQNQDKIKSIIGIINTAGITEKAPQAAILEMLIHVKLDKKIIEDIMKIA